MAIATSLSTAISGIGSIIMKIVQFFIRAEEHQITIARFILNEVEANSGTTLLI